MGKTTADQLAYDSFREDSRDDGIFDRRRVPVRVIPAMVGGQRPPSYSVSVDSAEHMLARGIAYMAPDGTRAVYLYSTAPRGHVREWRKTICYDPATGMSLPTMQLVPR